MAMFDQKFVSDVLEGIADDRGKAFRFKLAGHALKSVGLVVLITGLIQGFALAPPEVKNESIIGPFCRIAVHVWFWLDAIVPPVWWFFRSISPYPTLTLPLTMLSIWPSSVGWLGCSLGLMWLGFGVLKRSAFLSERASEEEKILKQQAPFLLQMQSRWSGQNIDISGDGNVVNAVNTINHIRETDKKSGWWTKPIGLIVIGVAINIVSKFLGTS